MLCSRLFGSVKKTCHPDSDAENKKDEKRQEKDENNGGRTFTAFVAICKTIDAPSGNFYHFFNADLLIIRKNIM